MPKLETWPEMNARHEREKIDLVASFAKMNFTQTKAAMILGMERGHLNIFAKRHNIEWPNMQRRHYEETYTPRSRTFTISKGGSRSSTR